MHAFNDVEGLAPGVVPTKDNTGGLSGKRFDLVAVVGDGTIVADSSRASHGSVALKATVTTSGKAYPEYIFDGRDEIKARCYCYLDSTPGALAIFNFTAVNGSTLGDIFISTSQQLKLQWPGNIGNGTTFKVPLHRWFRVEVRCKVSTGTLEVRLFAGPKIMFYGQTFGGMEAALLNNVGFGTGDSLSTHAVSDLQPPIGACWTSIAVASDGTVFLSGATQTPNTVSFASTYWGQTVTAFDTNIDDTYYIDSPTSKGVYKIKAGAPIWQVTVGFIDGVETVVGNTVNNLANWDINAYGEFPAYQLLQKSGGQWRLQQSMMATYSQLNARNANGAYVFPLGLNSLGQSYAPSLGWSECGILPFSGCIVGANYFMRSDHNSGTAFVIDPRSAGGGPKVVAYFQPPDYIKDTRTVISATVNGDGTITYVLSASIPSTVIASKTTVAVVGCTPAGYNIPKVKVKSITSTAGGARTQAAYTTVAVSDGTPPGGAGQAWTWTDNAEGPVDGVSASVGGTISSVFPAGAFTECLKCTGFGFAIPPNATITGITATCTRNSGPVGGIKDNHVWLVKAGVVNTAGTDQSTNANWSSGGLGVDFTLPVASTSDLWGTTLTPADVNDPGFGVAWRAKNTAVSASSAYIDAVSITVYYTVPSDPNNSVTVVWPDPGSGLTVGGTMNFLYQLSPLGVDVWGTSTTDEYFCVRYDTFGYDGAGARPFASQIFKYNSVTKTLTAATPVFFVINGGIGANSGGGFTDNGDFIQPCLTSGNQQDVAYFGRTGGAWPALAGADFVSCTPDTLIHTGLGLGSSGRPQWDSVTKCMFIPTSNYVTFVAVSGTGPSAVVTWDTTKKVWNPYGSYFPGVDNATLQLGLPWFDPTSRRYWVPIQATVNGTTDALYGAELYQLHNWFASFEADEILGPVPTEMRGALLARTADKITYDDVAINTGISGPGWTSPVSKVDFGLTNSNTGIGTLFFDEMGISDGPWIGPGGRTLKRVGALSGGFNVSQPFHCFVELVQKYTSDTVVFLDDDNPLISTPDNVVVPAGSTVANFDCTGLETDFKHSRSFTITAFLTPSASRTVRGTYLKPLEVVPLA